MKVYRSYQKSIAYDNKKKCEACKGDKKLDRPLEFSYHIEIEIFKYKSKTCYKTGRLDRRAIRVRYYCATSKGTRATYALFLDRLIHEMNSYI